jgi:hypothetical protein
MKRTLFAVILFCIGSCLVTFAATSRSHCWRVMWVRTTDILFNDSTFSGSPTWTQIESTEPPLSPSKACRIATDYVRNAKADQLTYRIAAIELFRYFDTDWWYYKVTLEAVVPKGDLSWQQTEPYKTILAMGQYAQSTNVPPHLAVAVLLSGDVVEPEK